MVKKILLAIGLVAFGLVNIGLANDGRSTFVGMSAFRVTHDDFPGIYKHIQVSKTIASIDDDIVYIPFTDWSRRLYGYLGTNGKDYSIGAGYFVVPGKFGLQLGSYYNDRTNKDFFCYGVYADAAVLKKVWRVTKTVVDAYIKAVE